ncbi:hypothetical protein PVAG01_01555 [Phlyctema vagabunda]|uniref:Uncharacterized protein n=1 Tax=Phlyctema vagabunda TaxID=108571 RepID=A0ABR4PYU8_9HELO
MDILQDYAVQAYHLYQDMDPYLRPMTSLLSNARAQLAPVFLPLFHQAAVFTQESPAVISIGLILFLLLVAMQLINLARRILMWWTRLVMGILFWGVIGLLVLLVAQRGVGRTAADLYDWGENLCQVWWREYRRWEAHQNQNQNRGTGRGNARMAGSSWR